MTWKPLEILPVAQTRGTECHGSLDVNLHMLDMPSSIEHLRQDTSQNRDSLWLFMSILHIAVKLQYWSVLIIYIHEYSCLMFFFFLKICHAAEAESQSSKGTPVQYHSGYSSVIGCYWICIDSAFRLFHLGRQRFWARALFDRGFLRSAVIDFQLLDINMLDQDHNRWKSHSCWDQHFLLLLQLRAILEF